MVPEDENVPTYSIANAITDIKALRVKIDEAMNEAARLADLCSSDNGDWSGQHGLSQSADKLIEAKMWAGHALGEIGSKLPEQYRDEYKPN